MTNITITVEPSLRKRMKEIRAVNWSEVARAAFQARIEAEERKSAAEAIRRMRNKDTTGWSGSEEIRKWRDRTK